MSSFACLSPELLLGGFHAASFCFRTALILFGTGSAKDIDLAVAAAREAFNTTWGKNVSGFQRAKLINKLADLIERDADELAALETLNNGKPFKIARSVLWKRTVKRCIDLFGLPGTLTLETLWGACATMRVGQTRSLDR